MLREVALSRLKELGRPVTHGPDIAPGEPSADRATYTASSGTGPTLHIGRSSCRNSWHRSGLAQSFRNL